MLIREAALPDLPQLVLLFEAYRQFYRKKPAPNAAHQFLKDRLENQESVIYVAEEDGQLLGFVQLYPIFSSTQLKRHWLLNDLFVEEVHRGKGISKALIALAKSLAIETQAAGLLLETEKSNTIGNQLYPATGFVLDEAHNYYFWENTGNPA